MRGAWALLLASSGAQQHGRFSRRFHARPSFAGQERLWRADRPIGLEGVNRSFLPSLTDLEAQPLVRKAKFFARDLRNWGRYAKALRCAQCRAPLTQIKTPCVGLGSLVVSFAQDYAKGIERGNASTLVQQECGWFVKDQSRPCAELFGCYAPALQEACPLASCAILEKPLGVKLKRKWGPTLHFSAVLYLALHGHLGLNREKPQPIAPEDCAIVHVRRGDACLNTNRRCHADDEYVEAAQLLRETYGLKHLRVVSDDLHLPIDRWTELGYEVEVLSRKEAYDISQSMAGAAKSLRDHFPEKRMQRGELSAAATADALRDMLGPRTLECRALIGSFSASMTKAIFGQLIIRHRRVPPFVSVGGCVRQARFFDADGEDFERGCSASPPSEAEQLRNREVALRERQEKFGRIQNRDSLRDPPVCAARLLKKRGVLAVLGADPGAAAATVFFTAIVNHALHAEAHKLLPWASLSAAHNPLVYDKPKHDGRSGLYATYFEPLEHVALRRAFTRGTIPDPSDPEAGDASCETLKAPERCAELDTCPRIGAAAGPVGGEPDASWYVNHTLNTSQVPTFHKSGPWRLWLHKKASWNVRAWYYGPKRSLPLDLGLYNKTWFASQRSRAHRMLTHYVRFKGDVVTRASLILDALAASIDTDLVRAGMGTCLVGVHARGTDADGRRSVQPVEAYVAVLAPVCRRLGAALAVYVATDDEKIASDPRWRALPCRVAVATGIRRGVDGKAAFEVHADRHATNVEVLTDIAVLSSADALVHGASAVSEAAQWLGWPRLHGASVHLEFPHSPSATTARLVEACAASSSSRWVARLRAWTLAGEAPPAAVL